MTKITTADLQALLRARSIKTGSFILASGKTSNFYVDARLTTMSPEGMLLIGALGLQAIRKRGWTPASIGGLTLGADPVAFAISRASIDTEGKGSPIKAFTVRKEAKTHGMGNLIEGPFVAGDPVVIVEDVITTGKSALTAIEAVKTAGGLILGVLAVVDRESGGHDVINARGIDVISLVSISDLLRS